MRLLLAEDEKPLSKALTAILERNNYSVMPSTFGIIISRSTASYSV